MNNQDQPENKLSKEQLAEIESDGKLMSYFFNEHSTTEGMGCSGMDTNQWRELAEKVARKYLLELEKYKLFYNERIENLQTTHAERIKDLEDGLRNLHKDSMASDFNEHWNSYKNAKQLLNHK